MNRLRRLFPRARAIAALTVLAVLVAGCEFGHTITVENSTSTQLRVFVKIPGGFLASVSPTPGESSTIAVDEEGTYYAFAVVDTEWLSYIRTKRDYLNGQLSDPETRRRLSVDELKAISDEVNSLTREIQRITERPWEGVSGCSGTLTDVPEGGPGSPQEPARAVIRIEDNPAGGFPAFILACT